LSFETFKLRQTICTIAEDCTIKLIHCEDLEEISIMRNWQTQRRAKQLGGAYPENERFSLVLTTDPWCKSLQTGHAHPRRETGPKSEQRT
jgi:hypothetical protein